MRRDECAGDVSDSAVLAALRFVILQLHLLLKFDFAFLKFLFIFAFLLLICMSSSWTVDENPLLVYGLKIFSFF